MRPIIELRVLGAVDLRGSDPEHVRALVSQPKRLALLVYLAIAAPRGFHRRDSLVALLWPESDQEHARAALRNALSFLRHHLGDAAIVTRGDEVGLDPTTFWCDVCAFDLSGDDGSAQEALALYQGDFLDGFHVSDAPDFERWLERERIRLRARAAEAAWALAGAEERAGNWVTAAGHARRAVALSPDYEQAARRLVELLDRAGDRAAALQEYGALERRLAEELEVQPSPETRALAEAVRARVTPRSIESPAQRASARPTPELAERLRAPARRPMLRSAAALGVLVLLAGGGWILWQRHPSAIATSPTRIAVFPFAVQGGSEFAYLGEGIVDLISADLDGVGDIRAVDPHAILSLRLAPGAATPGDLRRAAARLGAGSYVVGDIVEAGGRLRISARLHTLKQGDNEARALATAEGASARLFELVDGLTGQLLADRTESGARGFARLAAVTTPSLAALRAYLEGEHALRAGQHTTAIEAFQQATRLDTTFALAFYGLATAEDWFEGDPRLKYTAVRRAMRYRDRVGWRTRRLIEAFDAIQDERHADAEHLYREIVTAHPDEFQAWFFLGTLLGRRGAVLGRSYAEAREALQRAAALDTTAALPLLGLSLIAARNGRLAELDSLTDRVMQLEPGAFAPLTAATFRGQRAVLRRDTAEVERFVSTIQGYTVEDEQLAGGMVTWTTGDIAIGRRLWRLIAEPSRPPGMRALARMTLAKLEVTAGRWRAAKLELDSLQAIDYSIGIEHRAYFALTRFLPVPRSELEVLRAALTRWDPAKAQPSGTTDLLRAHAQLHPYLRLYLLGLLDARLGDSVAALRRAAQLEQLSSRSPISKFVLDLARTVRMEVSWVDGRFGEALAMLEQASFWTQIPSFLSTSVFIMRGGQRVRLGMDPSESVFSDYYYERFARAELLHAIGRSEEAARWYQPMADLFVYAGGPAALRLAQLHDRWGNAKQASEDYARFLRWWQNCEPELRSSVEQAQRRLAEFSAQP